MASFLLERNEQGVELWIVEGIEQVEFRQRKIQAVENVRIGVVIHEQCVVFLEVPEHVLRDEFLAVVDFDGLFTFVVFDNRDVLDDGVTVLGIAFGNLLAPEQSRDADGVANRERIVVDG